MGAVLLVLGLGPVGQSTELDELGRALISAYERNSAARSDRERLRVLADLESLLRRHPKSRHRHYVRHHLATVYWRHYKDYDKAQEWLREGLGDDPPPGERALLGVTLADLLATRGQPEGALRQLEVTWQFAQNVWLEADEHRDPSVARRAALRAAWHGARLFLSRAEKVWRMLGRPDLAGRAWLELAKHQLKLTGIPDEATRWMVVARARSALLNGGDWLLQAGDLAQARWAYDEAFSVMQLLPPDDRGNTPARWFRVAVRRAYLRSDKDELTRVLRGALTQPTFCNTCGGLALRLPARERLDFLAEVLAVLPEDWGDSVPAEDAEYAPLLYRYAMDAAFELGLDDEAAKYASELAERYPGRGSSPGLFGALERRLRPDASPRRTISRQALEKVAAQPTPAPSAREVSAARPVRDVIPATPVASRATRPSSQPVQTASAARAKTTRQDGSTNQKSPADGRPRNANGPTGATSTWDTNTLGVIAALAFVAICVIAYMAWRGKARRVA